jgi:hypothetical protein
MKKAYSSPAVLDQRTFAFETKQSGNHGGGGKGHGGGKGPGWGR